MITLKEISVGYRQDLPLISGVNLVAERGEMIALAGRNGTGKSTLLRSVLGLVPFLAGECFIMDTPSHEIDLRSRARTVSYVSSRITGLPSITVKELVSLGRMPYTGWMGRMSDGDHQKVEEALNIVGLLNYSDRQMDRLSDGERQRVMIARAFVQDTPLMLLDEPAAYLDIPNKYELIRILSQFRDHGKTILFSTHDLETAMMYVDKFWVIQEGTVQEGAPEDLGLSGLFGRMFESSGVGFDKESARFRVRPFQRGTVCLEGESGDQLLWTSHTLQRLGFEVTGNKGPMTVRVSSTGGANLWSVSREDGDKTFNSLYKLARFLTQNS